MSSTQLRSLNKVPELVEGPKCRSAVTKSRAFLAALSLVLSLSSLVLFSACGESTTTEKIVEVATGGTEIVSSVKDLPKCTKDNQGEQALVKGGNLGSRVCRRQVVCDGVEIRKRYGVRGGRYGLLG